MTSFYFVRPTDSLFVRGNIAFGDAGEHGASVMPPQPSLFAGAFRSAILGRDAKALAAFTQHGHTGRAEWDGVLGKLDHATGEVLAAGSFRITWLSLAGDISPRIEQNEIEAVLPLPADLVKLDLGFASLTPGEPNPLVADNRFLPRVAMLRTAKQEKPQTGAYLRQSGWVKHLAGNTPDKHADSIKAEHVHARDPRLGIGLNADSRTAESGLIYTTEGFAFSPKDSLFAATGFLVGVEGADGLLPETGFLRLGGDGRGAKYRRNKFRPVDPPLLDVIADVRRFRLILMTPGLFTGGWLPEHVDRDGDAYFLRVNGCIARLACAAVPRREVISGWDLFRWKPKDAHRVAPAGSVYWFEELKGDPGKLAEWVAGGLWGENSDLQRRAEGYNLASLAAWKE
ncbi:MAG: type III-B CRISPR module-associated protein Cmr3 [Betaproteobacteria bacterium]|nr:type III-B CRISPR module-associated protein Cmr3 [Betaproteobacteria bacterium]